MSDRTAVAAAVILLVMALACHCGASIEKDRNMRMLMELGSILALIASMIVTVIFIPD